MDEAFPDGFPKLAPLLAVADAPAALAWYRDILGAEELFRLTAPDGTVLHAEMALAGGLLMLGEAMPERATPGPDDLGGTSVRVHAHVEDVDAVFAAALEAGAEEVFPLEDRFYGDRSGRVRDPFGHEWILSTRIEELTPEEMQRRTDALYGE